MGCRTEPATVDYESVLTRLSKGPRVNISTVAEFFDSVDGELPALVLAKAGSSPARFSSFTATGRVPINHSDRDWEVFGKTDPIFRFTPTPQYTVSCRLCNRSSSTRAKGTSREASIIRGEWTRRSPRSRPRFGCGVGVCSTSRDMSGGTGVHIALHARRSPAQL